MEKGRDEGSEAKNGMKRVATYPLDRNQPRVFTRHGGRGGGFKEGRAKPKKPMDDTIRTEVSHQNENGERKGDLSLLMGKHTGVPKKSKILSGGEKTRKLLGRGKWNTKHNANRLWGGAHSE